MTMVINVHNPQWIPRRNGICVANHTSPIDIIILFAHNYYILVINYALVHYLKKVIIFYCFCCTISFIDNNIYQKKSTIFSY